MSTSASTRASAAPIADRRSYIPTSALAKVVAFDDAMMAVTLTDGRVVSVPLAWFPALRDASAEQRNAYVGGGGVALHWPGLDEDLSVAGLLAGADPRSA